jgi:hypothetical protein
MKSIIFIFVPGIFVDKSNLFLPQLLKNIEMYAILLSGMITWSYMRMLYIADVFYGVDRLYHTCEVWV